MAIFVGGTGRSGTTRLAEIIGQHPSVWHIPPETRFVVDQGGLEDLVRCLSTGHTPFHACDGLARFADLLTRKVAGRGRPGDLSRVDLPALFGPERYVIRHPVQVAASHLSMDWAPDDIESVCHWLEPMYRRWFAREDAGDERRLQVRLEDLAADWPDQRRRLFAHLHLGDVVTVATVSPERLAHWAPISSEDEACVRKRLEFAMDAFGYS